MNYLEKIHSYIPKGEQEVNDFANILNLMEIFPDTILYRENSIAHFTSSAFIVNEKKDKVLFVYHNNYNNWTWTGGHADGSNDLLTVAAHDAKEETGVKGIVPLSEEIAAIDILPIQQHTHNGCYVSAHLHLNLSFLFTVPEDSVVMTKPVDHKAIAWLPFTHLHLFSTEQHMRPVYNKLCQRLKDTFNK